MRSDYKETPVEGKVTVDYSLMMDAVLDGMLKHHEEEFIALALIKGKTTLIELAKEPEVVKRRLRIWLGQYAFTILGELKEYMGDSLILKEDGNVVMEDMNRGKHNT